MFLGKLTFTENVSIFKFTGSYFDKGDTFFGNSKRNTYQIYWKVKPKDQLSATIRFQMLYFKDRKVPTAASEYNLNNIIIIIFLKQPDGENHLETNAKVICMVHYLYLKSVR